MGPTVTFHVLGRHDRAARRPHRRRHCSSDVPAGTQSGTAEVSAFSGAARAEPSRHARGRRGRQTVSVRAEPATVPRQAAPSQVIAVVSDVSAAIPCPARRLFFPPTTARSVSTSGTDRRQRRGPNHADDEPGNGRAAPVAARKARPRSWSSTCPTITDQRPRRTKPIVGLPVTVHGHSRHRAAAATPLHNAVVDFGDGTPTVSLGAITSGDDGHARLRRADVYTVTATSPIPAASARQLDDRRRAACGRGSLGHLPRRRPAPSARRSRSPSR